MRMFAAGALAGLVSAGLLVASVAMGVSARAQDVITSPDWIRKPTQAEMRASWPYEAAQKGIGGKAVIQCSVDVQGLLQGCTVVSETPEGSGFGGSALLLAGSFKMKPKTVNGQPVAGGVVRIPIVFGDPGGPLSGPATGAVLQPIWETAPSFDDMAAAWPKRAGDVAVGGAVLRCTITKTGTLDNCATFNELPRDKGFGAAAKSLAGRFKLKLAPEELAKVRGSFVNVTFRFLNPASPEAALRKLGKPRWIRQLDPARIQAIFPKAAADAGVKSGLGVVECVVQPDGKLGGCKAVREDPAGLGFGDSALQVAAIMQLNPWSDDGRPVDGANIRLPVKFDLAADAPAAVPPKP